MVVVPRLAQLRPLRAQALLVLLLEAQVLDALLLAQDLRVALGEFFPQRDVLAVERQLLFLLLDPCLLLLLLKRASA